MKRKIISLWCYLFLSMACSSQDDSNPSEQPAAEDDIQLTATLSVSELNAGGSVEITCAAVKNKAPYTTSYTVELENSFASTLTQKDATHFVLVPQKATTYKVRCRSQELMSPYVSVTVTPGSAESIDTLLSQSSVDVTGTATVTCALVDAFNNPINNSVEAALEVPNELVKQTYQNQQFGLSSTKAGTYSVACKNSRFRDATPATLTIMPGRMEKVIARLDKPVVRAGEPVQINCEVSDIYGNIIPDADVDYDISPNDMDAIKSVDTFTLFTASPYEISCFHARDALASTGATLTITPNIPNTLTVSLEANACYPQNLPLPLSYQAHDAYANVIPDALFVITSAGAGIEIRSDGVIVKNEGKFNLTVDINGEKTANIVAQTFALTVDSTPPVITLTSPKRADMLQQDLNINVAVTGRITDSSKLAGSTFQLNNETPVTGTSNSFTYNKLGRLGLNSIHMTARDTCGNERTLHQTFLLSHTYQNDFVNNGFVNNALELYVEQSIIDDGKRNDVRDENPDDDFVTLANGLLKEVNYNAMIAERTVLMEEPVTLNCNLNGASTVSGTRKAELIKKNPVTILPKIDYVTLGEGSIKAQVSLTNITLPFSFKYSTPVCGAGVKSEGSLSVNVIVPSISLVINLLDLAIANGIVQKPTIKEIKVEIPPNQLPTIQITDVRSAENSWLIDEFNNNFVPSLIASYTTDVLKMVNEQASKNLSEMLASYLNNFIFQRTLTLPQPSTAQLTAAFKINELKLFEVTNAQNIKEGAVHLSVATKWDAAPSSIAHTPTKGSILRGVKVPDFDTFDDTTFGMNISDDFLNHVLFAAWKSGALDFADVIKTAKEQNIKGISDYGDSSLKIKPLLPPVIMPGKDGYAVEIALGDLEIEGIVDVQAILKPGTSLAMPKMHVKLFASAVLNVDVEYNPTDKKLVLMVDKVPDIQIQIESLDDMSYQGQLSKSLTDLIHLVIAHQLEKTVAGVKIPNLKLAGFLDSDAYFSLMEVSVERTAEKSHTLLRGHLR